MSIIRSYSISNVSLRVECELNGLSKRVTDVIEDYVFMVKNSAISNSHNVTLRFNDDNFTVRIPETAQELYSSPTLRVLKDGDFCYLIKGNSVFKLDLVNSLGIGYMDSAFWEGSIKSRQEFLILSLLWLLRKHGLCGLHANGLVKDGSGILFIGDTGSGKSTTALSLIRQGWSYLSDDVTMLRDSANGVEALAFQKGFFFSPDLANHYPELNKAVETSSLNGQKRFLDISSIYPGRFVSSCFPKALIFPKIVPQDKSRLVPINNTKALIQIVENSGGIMVDKELVVKQMQVLKRLVYQTNGYQLLAGRDLHEDPKKISRVLSGVISESLFKDESNQSHNQNKV